MPSLYRSKKVNGRHIAEHRLVMESVLRRRLERFEFVHHRNHNRLDNRLENLELMSPQEHSQHHNQKYPIVKHCVVCGAEFTPHETKRSRQQICGNPECKTAIMRDHCHNKRLTDDDLAAIRARRGQGERLRNIAMDFDITETTVSMISLRRSPYDVR